MVRWNAGTEHVKTGGLLGNHKLNKILRLGCRFSPGATTIR